MDDTDGGLRQTIPPYPGMELSAAARQRVTVTERVATSTNGSPDARVLTYRPRATTDRLPLVLRVHGGGFTHLRADSFPAIDARIALMGAFVVSVDYRLAPTHRFPAAVDDCYAALVWAAQLPDVSGAPILVTGSSAGGALAAGLTHLSRDLGGPRIDHLLLHVPVLDDRLGTPSMRRSVERSGYHRMWLDYLGPDVDRDATSPYAAPARGTDLSRLPPTFIQVNQLDPLRDEGISYAARLNAVDVSVELHCAPGLTHGALPQASRAAGDAQLVFDLALRRALG